MHIEMFSFLFGSVLSALEFVICVQDVFFKMFFRPSVRNVLSNVKSG
jgi:hypothetical protein